eukprot:PhF_6_TR8320/c0_g2_i1/m.12930
MELEMDTIASPRAGLTKYIDLQRELRPDLYNECDSADADQKSMQLRNKHVAEEYHSLGNTELHRALLPTPPNTSIEVQKPLSVLQVVDMITERPQLVNIPNGNGRTALHYLFMMVESRPRLGHFLNTFLSLGASIYACDRNGMSPMALLNQYEYQHRTYIYNYVRRVQMNTQSTPNRKRLCDAMRWDIENPMIGNRTIAASYLDDHLFYTVCEQRIVLHSATDGSAVVVFESNSDSASLGGDDHIGRILSSVVVLPLMKHTDTSKAVDVLWLNTGTFVVVTLDRDAGSVASKVPIRGVEMLQYDTIPKRSCVPAAAAGVVHAIGASRLVLAGFRNTTAWVCSFPTAPTTHDAVLSSLRPRSPDEPISHISDFDDVEFREYQDPYIFPSCGGVVVTSTSTERRQVIFSSWDARIPPLYFDLNVQEFLLDPKKSFPFSYFPCSVTQYITEACSKRGAIAVLRGDVNIVTLQDDGSWKKSFELPMDGISMDPYAVYNIPNSDLSLIVRFPTGNNLFHELLLYHHELQKTGFLCRIMCSVDGCGTPGGYASNPTSPRRAKGASPKSDKFNPAAMSPRANRKPTLCIDIPENSNFAQSSDIDVVLDPSKTYMVSKTGKYLFAFHRKSPPKLSAVAVYDLQDMIESYYYNQYVNALFTPSSTKLSKTLGTIQAPSGHVCLVFTDVEMSTMLWDQCEEGMAKALNIHNEIMRDEMKMFNGYEVKTEGDAFMVTFGSTLDALNWCLSCQVKLLTMPWPQELQKFDVCKSIPPLWGGLRVRMGFHAGRPVVSDDPTTGRKDYFGPVVNLSARVGGSGKGGQIVCSADALKEIAQYCFFSESEFKQHFGPRDKIEGDDEDEDCEDELEDDFSHRTVVPVSVRFLDTKRFKGISVLQDIFEILPLDLCARFGMRKEDVPRQYGPLSRRLGIYYPGGDKDDKEAEVSSAPLPPAPPPPPPPPTPLITDVNALLQSIDELSKLTEGKADGDKCFSRDALKGVLERAHKVRAAIEAQK